MVGSALATVLLGLLGIALAMVAMVVPQLDELSAVGEGHARALAAASELRESLDDLCRRTIIAAATPGAKVDASAALQREQAALERLEPFATDPDERAAMLRMRSGLRQAIGSATRVEGALAAGDRHEATTQASSLADYGREVSRGAEQLVRHNALEVRELAAGVRASLRRSTAVAAVMTLAILVATLVMIRQAARAEAGHVRLLARNQDELAAFASRAAHELRTPLQTLRLALHVLRTSPGQSLAMERALRSARRMQQIIDDVLRFSRSGGAPEPGVHCAVSAVTTGSGSRR
jgi:signal transduction histidine kinase